MFVCLSIKFMYRIEKTEPNSSSLTEVATPLLEFTYGITQCYLPPGRGDILAFTPSQNWYSI